MGIGMSEGDIVNEQDLHCVTNFGFMNWARTFGCKPSLYFEPTSTHALTCILKHATSNSKKVRVCGKGHSPSDIACCNDYLVSLSRMNKILDINYSALTVKVEAGCTLESLNEALFKQDLALPNIGSISEITVGGTVSVATHGTGSQFGSICSLVEEMTVLTGNLETIVLKKGDSEFNAFVCSLGALGIITNVVLRVEKAFQLKAIQTSQKLEKTLFELPKLVNSAEHVRFWWFPHTDETIVWKANRVYGEPTVQGYSWFWDKFVGYYLLESLYYVSTFCSWMVPLINKAYFALLFKGDKLNVDTSFKVFNFDCLFKQYVTEWCIPFEKCADAVLDLQNAIENNGLKAHFPVEVRFVGADSAFLSPANGRLSCYIGIIMYRPFGKDVPIKKYWSEYESIMQVYGGRPHWAKQHNLKREDLCRLYPMFDSFRALCIKHDPNKLFQNKYLERILN